MLKLLMSFLKVFTKTFIDVSLQVAADELSTYAYAKKPDRTRKASVPYNRLSEMRRNGYAGYTAPFSPRHDETTTEEKVDNDLEPEYRGTSDVKLGIRVPIRNYTKARELLIKHDLL